MQDNLRNIHDAGRVINILLRAMRLVPSNTPEEAAKKYLTPDLSAFRDDIDHAGIVIEPGIPQFSFFPNGKVFLAGSGVVLEVVHPTVGTHYAIKFVRPSFFDVTPSPDTVFTDFKLEFFKHAALSHRNVARLLGTARLIEELPGRRPTSYDPILMEWIDGATPLLLHIYRTLTAAQGGFRYLIDVLVQCFSALDYIHERGIIHWDIKSDNIFVSKSGEVKLADFGNSRLLADTTRSRVVYTTTGHFPPALDDWVEHVDNTESSNRIRIEFPTDQDMKEWDHRWVDMWMLAREAMELLKSEAEEYSVSKTFQEPADFFKQNRTPKWVRGRTARKLLKADPDRQEYLLECLRTIFRRLLVPNRPENNRYYRSARAVVDDLNRLEPEFGAAQDVGELWAIPQDILRLPPEENVPFASRIARLYDSSLLARLDLHRQLGSVHHVYPGAKHTRKEHAAGVFFRACDYARGLFADQTNVFWRLCVERRDIEALLFAALVHDAGHIAFGHFVEEMKGLVGELKHENYLLCILDPIRFAIRPKQSDDILHHREQMLRLVNRDWMNGDRGGRTAEGFLAEVAEIISPSASVGNYDRNAIYDYDRCSEIKRYVLHSIIDSSIDVDKLDYLVRDAHHCGIKYPQGIDVERFLQSITVVSDVSRVAGYAPTRDGLSQFTPRIGVTQKGVLPTESILIARYQLFKSVYWHHTTRAETAMLQFVVAELTAALVLRAEQDKDDVALHEIEGLIETFRSLDDDRAVEWLLVRAPAVIADADLCDKIKRCCRCLLGERRYLYKEIFELRYERQVADSTFGLFQELSNWADMADQGGPNNYLSATRAKRLRLVESINSQLKLNLRYGHILVDIPPAGKDQVSDIFVDFGPDVRSMHDVSPMGHAVRDTFERWTRSVRIFMEPWALSRYDARGGSRNDLANACREALSDQGNLPIRRKQQK